MFDGVHSSIFWRAYIILLTRPPCDVWWNRLKLGFFQNILISMKLCHLDKTFEFESLYYFKLFSFYVNYVIVLQIFQIFLYFCNNNTICEYECCKIITNYVSFVKKTILLSINIFDVKETVNHLTTFCNNVQFMEIQSFRNQKIHYFIT